MRRRNAKAQRRRQANGGVGARSMQQSLGVLPQVKNSLTMNLTVRFIADGAVATDINKYHIRNLLGMGYHSAILDGMYRLIDSYKIQRIRVCAAAVASVSPVTVSIDWYGTTNGKSVQQSATSMGICPAVLVTQPPANSLAAMWQLGTNVALFRMVCPQYAVVDMTMNVVLVDSNAGEFLTSTNTASDAILTCKYLDSVLGSSTGHLVPQGYQPLAI
jgi:hypothetical protein